MTLANESARLMACMKDADRQGAKTRVEELLDAGTPAAEVMTQVLDPALEAIGELWSQELISLSQAFVVAKIAEDVLLRCLPEGETAPTPGKGAVVIGNIEDDFHSLGRRIIASFLVAGGWDVHDLGNDVPAETFLEKALEVEASVIGVSAMMQTTALNIRKLRDLIDARGLGGKIKLAVGGAVFNWRPQLIEEVGADGSATNAAEVGALFETLKTRAAS